MTSASKNAASRPHRGGRRSRSQRTRARGLRGRRPTPAARRRHDHSSARPTRSRRSTRPARTTTARSPCRRRSSRTWSTPTTTAPRSSPTSPSRPSSPSPTEYTVTLPEGLKWANGNDLTSSDVKFSFDRNLAIADPNGASSLLYNLDSVETPDDTTVVFNLKAENDQVFPFILTSFPGADRRRGGLLGRRAHPRRGHRRRRTPSAARTSITSYDFNKTVEFTPNRELPGPARRGRSTTASS